MIVAAVDTDTCLTPAWVLDLVTGIVGAEYSDPCPAGGSGGLNDERDLFEPTVWRGPVFCNPPYSAPGPWVERCVRHAADGNAVVALVKLDPSTTWWPEADALGLIRGRVRFEGPYAKGRPAPFPSALLLWNCRTQDHPRVTWWEVVG